MKTKTCGKCRYYVSELKRCNMRKIICNIQPTDIGCSCFERKPKQLPTNGDKIIAGGNRAIAEVAKKRCQHCIYKNDPYCFKVDCADGIEAWLNAPADCVAENSESAKQADLCCKSVKESEGEDE